MSLQRRIEKVRRTALDISAAALLAAVQATTAFADGPAADPSAQPTPFQFILGSVNFFLLAFFVYYMLVLRPQQVKQEQQQRFLRDLKKDDEVITTGGILGRVRDVSPEYIGVEIASGVKIRVRPEFVNSALAAAPNAAANGSGPTTAKSSEKERKAK